MMVQDKLSSIEVTLTKLTQTGESGAVFCDVAVTCIAEPPHTASLTSHP